MTDYMEETGSLLARLKRSKSEPGLEFFLVLYDEKKYAVHKQTKSGPEKVFTTSLISRD